jgi:hypothetical protein
VEIDRCGVCGARARRAKGRSAAWLSRNHRAGAHATNPAPQASPSTPPTLMSVGTMRGGCGFSGTRAKCSRPSVLGSKNHRRADWPTPTYARCCRCTTLQMSKRPGCRRPSGASPSTRAHASRSTRRRPCSTRSSFPISRPCWDCRSGRQPSRCACTAIRFGWLARTARSTRTSGSSRPRPTNSVASPTTPQRSTRHSASTRPRRKG